MLAQAEVEDLIQDVRQLVAEAERALEATRDALDYLHRAMDEAAMLRRQRAEERAEPPG
jgi:uncharacterized coiled-coil protein SlyX